MFVFDKFTKKVKIAPVEVYVDNVAFRLHYRITFWFLLACALLVSTREFIKEHISCISDDKIKTVINTYCFFSSTFTVIKHHNFTATNDDDIFNTLLTGAVHPGVGPYIPGQDAIIRHAYYQWVPFVLFLQALLFYAPHFIWDNLEGGRMAGIIGYMKTSYLTTTGEMESRTINGNKIESDTRRKQKILWLKDAYLALSRFKVNRDWSKRLVLCEFLNMINLILQIFLLDKFLQGQFLQLGIKWIQYDDDVLNMVFPKVTKCTFHKYGHSGDVQTHDTLCVMALNIINEKIYCLLWFWFVILFIITVCGLVWRALTFILHRRSPAFNKWIWGELSPGPALKKNDILIVTKCLCYSDWLFLYYLGKNMNGIMFRTLVTHISESLQKKSPLQDAYLTLEQTPTSKHKGENESHC